MTIYVASFYSSVGRSPPSSWISLSLHFLASSFWALFFLCLLFRHFLFLALLLFFFFFSPSDLMSSKELVMGARTARERESCSFVWPASWFHNSGYWDIYSSTPVLETRKILFYNEHWCEMNMSWSILGTLRSVSVMAMLCGASSGLKMLASFA